MRYQGNRNPDYKPNDEFYTPQWLFDKMGVQFDLDPASPHEGSFVPTSKHYCKCCLDGYEQEWQGFIWMNPPFSESKKWVKKFMNHRNGIALLPASKARWFQEIWAECDGLVLLPYDMKFVYQHQTTNGIFMPTYLVGYGSKAVEAISKIGIIRTCA